MRRRCVALREANGGHTRYWLVFGKKQSSCPGPCHFQTGLLQCSSSWTIKPLQMIQNAAARLVFNEPKRAHVIPLFMSLHWLPVAARIKFKTLMLVYRTTTGSAPSYFHSLPLQKSEICEWATLSGAIIERHKITFQNVFIHCSWLVEWTSHPYPECWIPDDFQATPENSSLPSTTDFIKTKQKKTKKTHYFLSLISPCLASIYSE